jgi:hypothetical protein
MALSSGIRGLHSRPLSVQLNQRMTILRRMSLLTVATALLTTVHAAQQQPAGYPSTGLPPQTQTNPRPHLGSTGYGPPLSTALPTSGSFSRGLTMGAQSTGRRPSISASAGAPSPFASSHVGTRAALNSKVQPSFLPNMAPTGRSMARVSVFRGVYGGVGW